MSKSIPAIERYMSASPFSIGIDQTLTHAHAAMRTHHVRHLPVLSGGEIVGIVSDRDIHFIEALRDVDPDKVTVEEAMTSVVYSVPPEMPLDQVAREMAEHKYGCAVVMSHNKVVGVFTTVDALRALTDVLADKH